MAEFLPSIVGIVAVGPYRGEVVDNDDSELKHEHLGRIKVRVPQLYGPKEDVKDVDLPWAWPMFLMGGGIVDKDEEKPIRHGLVTIPPIGSTVWVFLEQGDIRKPLWIGTWYGERDTEKKGKGSEIPKEAEIDNDYNEEDKHYPNIWLLKFPWHKDGIWLRCTKDKRFEIIFAGENTISLKQTGDDRDEGGKITIEAKSKDWDIDVVAREGNISLTTTNKDKQISLLSAGKIVIQAAKSIEVTSGGTAKFKAVGVNSFESNVLIQGVAPNASGFAGVIPGDVRHAHR